MDKRIKLLKRELKGKSLDAILISDLLNLFYLTGFSGSNGLAIVKRNQARPFFYTDFRYQEQGKYEVKGCNVVILNRNLFLSFPVENLKDIKTCGFESNHLSYANYILIKKQMKGKVRLIPQSDMVENLRMIKDEHELNKIKKAVKLTDDTFQNILKIVKPNITEKDLASEIDYQFKKCCEIAFQTIVLFAERSALPHGQSSFRKLKNGDVIVFDMGARFESYCADMTRTVVLGRASAKVRKVYDIVLVAQRRALEKIRAGIRASEIDHYARDYIKEKGFADYFGHGLGHGIGIAVHEKPTLARQSSDVLKVNQTVTVEPGIYLPNEFGIRIEDLIVVKEHGCAILSQSPKELIEL